MLRDWLRWVTRNPHYKLLSFLLALSAWLWVQQGQVQESQVRARVDWRLPTGMMPVEQLPTQVTLTVLGTGSDVRRARGQEIRLIANVPTSGVGEQHIEFASLPIEGVPENIEVLACVPSAMTFVLDEVVTRKVKVLPVMVGDPETGHKVQTVAVDPAVVELDGPRSIVGMLTEVNTRPIDVSGLASDAVVPIELELPRSVTPPGAPPRAHISIVPELERSTVPSVPVVVLHQRGWVVRPDVLEVTLEGPALALEQVSRNEVVAFVHLPDAPERPFYEAQWGPKEGVRLRVLHGGGESVEVVRVEPPLVEVVRQ